MRINVNGSLCRRLGVLASAMAIVGITMVGASPASAQAQPAPDWEERRLPDLVISHVSGFGVVTIKNDGPGLAGGSWAQFGAVGIANAWHWVPELFPGAEHSFLDSRLTMNCAWVAADDWENFVVESNENNNSRRTSPCVT